MLIYEKRDKWRECSGVQYLLSYRPSGVSSLSLAEGFNERRCVQFILTAFYARMKKRNRKTGDILQKTAGVCAASG